MILQQRSYQLAGSKLEYKVRKYHLLCYAMTCDDNWLRKPGAYSLRELIAGKLAAIRLTRVRLLNLGHVEERCIIAQRGGLHIS